MLVLLKCYADEDYIGRVNSQITVYSDMVLEPDNTDEKKYSIFTEFRRQSFCSLTSNFILDRESEVVTHLMFVSLRSEIGSLFKLEVVYF